MEDGALPGTSRKADDEKNPTQELSRGAKPKKPVHKRKKEKEPDSPKKPTAKPDTKSGEGVSGNDQTKCRLGLIIGHQIGSGSFAKVYKAFSCQHNKDVAVKIFKRSDIPQNYFNKFIVREIEVIKELHHRNLVKFYDCQFTTKRYNIFPCCGNSSVTDLFHFSVESF